MTWLRQVATRLWYRLQVQRSEWREALTFRLPSADLRARLRSFMADKALTRTAALLPTEGQPQRQAAMTVQLDGDVQLFVPSNFGAQQEDRARLADLQAAVAAELAQLQAALPHNWAALLGVVLKLLALGLTGWGGWGSGQAAFAWQGTASALVAAWQAPHPGPAAVWQTLTLLHAPIVAACGLLGLSFGRGLRLMLMRVVVFVVRRRLGWLTASA